MITKTELRKKIQQNNFMIRGIEKHPEVLINWKINDLKEKNSKLAQQIKEMGG